MGNQVTARYFAQFYFGQYRRLNNPAGNELVVDQGTWNRLGPAGQQEFRELLNQFQFELQRRGITDGIEFAQLWRVQLSQDVWMIGNGQHFLEGVASPRQDVIEALFTDAVQNLNR